jgi:hypothetical protein
MVKKKNRKQGKPFQKHQLNEDMKLLFLCASPSQLKQSLHEVYASFLQNIDFTIGRDDFKEIAMDLYFLHHFLEKAERYEEKG